MDACFRLLGGQKTALTILGLGMSVFVARADLFVSDFNNDVVFHFRDDLTLANLNFITGPAGLALGPDGNLYVATAFDFINGASVQIFDPSLGGASTGTFASHVTDNNMNNPAALAFDSSGNLYVSDLQNKILVYPSTGVSNIAVLTDFDVNAPSGLAFGPGGVLYIADENSGSVLKYESGAFTKLNTSGAFMNIPHDVVVGPDGNLYVLDAGITTGIYQLNPTTGFATRIVDYSTNLFFANDMVLSADGKLLVSGVDNGTGEGEILQYGLDGSGGGIYLNLGSTTYPTYMLVTVPEPSTAALLAIIGGGLAAWRLRRKQR